MGLDNNRNDMLLYLSSGEKFGAPSDDLMAYCLGGSATNRWADKAVTLCIFENGTLASNCDVSISLSQVLNATLRLFGGIG